MSITLIDAPLELMFEMWTNPSHFSKWLAPTGFEMQFIRADIKAGGSSFYFMTGPGGVPTFGLAAVDVKAAGFKQTVKLHAFAFGR